MWLCGGHILQRNERCWKQSSGVEDRKSRGTEVVMGIFNIWLEELGHSTEVISRRLRGFFSSGHVME